LKIPAGFPGLIAKIAFVAGVLVAGVLLAKQDEPNAGASAVGAFIANEEKVRATSTEAGTSDQVFDLPDVTALQALGKLDPETRDAAVTSMREYYRYRQSGYEHRRAVFDWQLRSSKIIFWVVIVMVGVGIYFSGVQFHAALRSQPTPDAEEGKQAATTPVAAASGAGLETSIEAGSGGIKVSSPVLGVIILVISLLFFYLYLVHIYPISEIW